MARPLRIEFPGAWYHVMNRGAGRRAIFREEEHYALFLDLLETLAVRFAVQTHAYCLMGNHYHLLLHTPRGGLGRGMRHLDGVYTQQFNRLTGTDGSLFRGRYKAILVDADSYLTQVSRYIHRNPLEAAMVERLADYRWSSYPAYLERRRRPAWLHCASVLDAVGGGAGAYRRFVEGAVADDEVAGFFVKLRQSPVLGSDAFRAKAERHVAGNTRDMPQASKVRGVVPLHRVIAVVSAVFGVNAKPLQSGARPAGQMTVARDVALWRAQIESQMSLSALAEAFKLGHYTSVATAIGRARQRAEEDRATRDLVEQVCAQLNSNK